MFRNIHVVMIALLALLLPALALATAPPELRDLDPLQDEAPVLLKQLRLPGDSRPALEKIVLPLQAKLALPAEQTLRVVVTLHEPLLDLGSVPPGNDVRARHLGALEHELVRQAAPLGFQPVRGFALFPIVIGEIPVGQLERFAALPAVRFVEEEKTYFPTRTQGGALIRSDDLRNQHGARGQGIGVAILDTGIDWTHPELVGQVTAQGDFTGTTGNGFDDQGHGTAVAGIIAGKQGGMAPAASVWAMKVLRAVGGGTDAMIIAGLQSVLANQNNFGGVHVVNMSLGGGGPFNAFCDNVIPSYTTVFQNLYQAGILVLVASGNDAFKNGIASPACHSWNLSVGAVYDANIGGAGFSNCSNPVTFADLVTCYSNSGTPLDLLGPSHCAVTPKLGGGFETCFGGTSAATPYTAGVVAQLLSLTSKTPNEMYNILVSTGVPVNDPANSVVRSRIDALAAANQFLIFTDGFESGNISAW